MPTLRSEASSTSGHPLVADALQRAVELPGTTLRVADVRALIQFKLYAGGRRSALDILALLELNPLDRDELRRSCAEIGLMHDLERVLDMETRGA